MAPFAFPSTYTFDAVGQLTDADHATGRTDEAYTFDSTGNRTGGDYVVSSKNQTDESTEYEYEYDRNGNRTKRLKTADNSYEIYEFDHRNRLTDVKFYNSSHVLQKTIVYAYDAFNRMVRRTFDSDGPGGTAATDQFFAGFDGMHATLEFDGANRTDLTHRYLWGLGADELLADEQVTSTSSDGDILWALGDQVGTIRDIGEWNASTTEFEITNHREYDSFGNLISETDTSVDVDFGFNGKWTDSETEYTHHLNRWLDPVIGKWISEDPIGFAGGDANISRFVANQVLSHMDTDGLHGHSGGGGGKTIITTGGTGGQDPEQEYDTKDDGSVTFDMNETWHPDNLKRLDIQGYVEIANSEIDMGGHKFPFERWVDNKDGTTWYIRDWENGTRTAYPTLDALKKPIKDAWELEAMRAAATQTTTSATLGTMLWGGFKFGPKVPKFGGLSGRLDPKNGLPIVNPNFTPKPTTLGKVGETLAGITGNKTKILINGRNRIPDGLTQTILTEVKNVKNLSYTRQLRDFSDFAKQTGRTYELYVRPTTTLSGPLREAIRNGDIILRYIPGT